MEMRLCLAWKLIKLCIIALILTVPGSEGFSASLSPAPSVLPVEQVPHYIQDAAPPIGPVLAQASTPATPLKPSDASVPPLLAVPQHASAPAPLVVSPHESNPPPSASSPPNLPVLTHAPTQSSSLVSPSGSPAPPTSAPTSPIVPQSTPLIQPAVVPKHASSPLLMTMPPSASTLPTSPEIPEASPPFLPVMPRHAFAPPSPVLQTHAPNPLPRVIPSSALPTPPSAAPPRASAPRPLAVPRDASSQAPPPGPPLAMPPHASHLPTPTLLPTASPPPFALVPPHATAPSVPPVMPTHALAQPPQMVPHDTSSRAPPPLVTPPHTSTLSAPSLLPNASPPPFALVPPHATEPPLPPATPKHALAQPPQVVPQGASSRAPKPVAVLPFVSALPPPSLLPNASPPPFSLVPPHATAPPVPPVTPTHALAQPPQVVPHSTSRAPQPFAMSPSVSTLPPPSLLPNASPPPFALLPPRATKPPVPPVTPKHALAQPPQVAPHDASSRAPKPAAVPPSVSTLPTPSLLPSASPPPSALMPPHAASLPPPLAPHTPVLPHASALSPSMVIHNASSLAPPSLAVPPHASTLPAPSLLPNVSPPPSAPVPPHAASPSAPVVPQTPVLPHTSALAPSVITHNASSQAPPSSVIPPHSSTLPAPSVLPNVSPPSLTQVPPHAFAPPPHLLPSHGLVPQAPVLPRASAPTLPVVSQNTSALVPPPFEVPSILPNLSPPPSPLVPPPATAHRSPANPTHAVTPPSPAVPQHAFAAPTPAELPDISAPPPPLLPGNVLPAPPDASQRDNSSAPEVPTSPGSFPYIAPPNPKSKTPSDIAPAPLPTVEHSPNNGSHNHPDKALSPATAPSVHKSTQKPNFASAPIVFSPESSPSEGPHSASASPISVNSHRYPREKANSPAPSLVLVPPSASNLVPPPASSQQGQVESPHPSYAPKSSPDSPESDRPLPSPNPGTTMSKASSPAPLAVAYVSPAPPPSPRASSDNSNIPVPSPKISPSASATRALKRPRAPPIQALPPPPPNDDCAYLTCSEPLTNTPPGTPCGCVYPMQVALRLSVELYTFFPLVSELAREIATGVFLKGSQVRIMGANAATQEPEKTIVLVDLVPLGAKFDNVTAYLIYERFWHKQVSIDRSLYGDYDVLYVHYLGLPPSPPMAPSDIAVIDGIPYATDPNGSKIHPLGVEVPLRRHRHRLSGSIIAVIVFSAVVGLLICFSVVWLLVARHTRLVRQPELPPNAGPSLTRSSGPGDHSTGSGPSSATLSFQSSLAPYTGSAKTFSAGEIEKATDNFNPSRILGEGGFGCVYSGVLEDETLVAVKVLKRDDQQGGREFLAEVEMLSRLHHRNLVKLIGICVDDRVRCLVYELIPNGSVESHLHGLDKERAPLDWVARMKIALGAARGLAYLHEDSSPRVIHRDFKASNILLEHDFTPKVSDFGLARTAMDEENRHISTRVMGTFGYVAPEYAMTGHLLVKSDVYSYGVVLLELLTGRKPVDMSQPPGQENLVTWARPFLTNRAGLVSIIDPSLGPDISFDNVLKVAAIASMCVQPEVSHRPFMGEVVQALKLVCAEGNVSRDGNSSSRSHVDLSDLDVKVSPAPEKVDSSKMQYSPNGCVSGLDIEKGLSVSDIFSNGSTGFRREVSGSFRRHSASGPIKTRFWKKMRRSFQGSTSEHGISYGLWPGSH